MQSQDSSSSALLPGSRQVAPLRDSPSDSRISLSSDASASSDNAPANAPATLYSGSSSEISSTAASENSNSEFSDKTSANVSIADATPDQIPWSPPPVPDIPKMSSTTVSSGSDSSSSATSSSETYENAGSSSSVDVPFSPPPIASTPQTKALKTSHGSDLSDSTDSSNVSPSSNSDLSSQSSESSDEPWSPPPVAWSPPPVAWSPPPIPSPLSQSSTLSGKTLTSSRSDSSSNSKDSMSANPVKTAKPTASKSPPSSDEGAASPAPVTRPPTVTKKLKESYDDSQTLLTSKSPEGSNKGNTTYEAEVTFESIESTSPSPAPRTRTPMVGFQIKHAADASSDLVGIVIPADIPDVKNSTARAVTKHTDPGSQDQSEMQTTKDDHLVVLGDTASAIIYTDGSQMTTFQKYSRGNGDLQALRDSSGSFSHLIVGGGNRANLPPGASISLSATSQEIQNALLYASYALGIVSAILLMFFHVLALHRPPWLRGTSHGNRRASIEWFTPNVWELAVVVGYMQHINSIAMLELTKAPQIVLDYTDSFSIVNLHFSSVTTTAASVAARRLQLIILTGVVAFADRIGINEDEVLLNAFWTFLAVLAAVVMLFALFAGSAYYNHSMSEDAKSAFYPTQLRHSSAMCIVGLGVALWILSIFPLVSMSSFEVVMELRYRVGFGLAVALFSLWAVVGGGLSFTFLSVRAIPNNDAFRFKYFAVWGTLYGGSKMTFRYFFVIAVGVQALLGIATGAIQGVPTQLVALMVSHLLFVVAAVIIRPFAASWVLIFVVGLRVVAIVNVLCCFAFLTSSELSMFWRAIVAQGFVIFNSLMFFLFFARYVTMFVLVLKRWSSFAQRDSFQQSHHHNLKHQQGIYDRESENPVFLTYDMRHHKQFNEYNDGGRFDASGAGFTPTQGSEHGDFSEFTSSRFASTPVFATGRSYNQQQHASTPSSFFSDPRSHEHFYQ
ncbi:putative transient receptor potential channel Flc/Pkd2 [Plasmopara halstedii]